MTPNEIILALVDVASAAFAVQHGASEFMQQTHVDGDDVKSLQEKLAILDQLPQPANMPPLTPSAKARYYMQSFLGGAPVEIDGKEFSAAFLLSSLGEEVQPPLMPGVLRKPANDGWVLAKETVVEMPDGKKELGYTMIHGLPVFTDEQDAHKSHGELNLPLGWVVMRVQQLIPGYVLPEVALADIEAQQRAVRGFGNPSAAEINDITMDVLGKWPSFEAQSWACKVVTAVAEKLRSQDIAAARDKLLADTATEAHRIWNDADLLASLRRLCGYVENGSSESIGISQDDATHEWILRIGPSMSPRVRHFHARSFHQVIRLAADDMLENETCKFCGFEVEFPCDEPPPDICSAAIRAAEKQKRSKPDVKVTANVANAVQSFEAVAAAVKESARDLMKATLIQLKDEVDSTTAKRIITKVGGAQKMMDIPEALVVAVTIAASDRIALERKLKVLRAEGNHGAVEALLRGIDEVSPAVRIIQDNVQRVVTETREAFNVATHWPTPPLPLPDPVMVGSPPCQSFAPREKVESDDAAGLPAEAPQGQGGEFDGGGASGNF
jgi:hypothetical protein